LKGIGLFALVAAATIQSGCGERNVYAPPPPPAVTVASPVRRDVTDWVEFTGQTAPFLRVDIRARVKGFLKEILYDPSRPVAKGALLFRIDPAEYQAALNSARAELRSREADLTLADATVKRYETAYETRAVSEVQLLEARAKRDVAEAAVNAADAAVKHAELELGYTRIEAPISGHISEKQVDVGNLVGASEPTLLATLVHDEKIYAYFNVPEQDVLRARSSRTRPPGEKPGIQCEMALATDTGFPHVGEVDYADPEIDKATGTLRVRAVFENPNRDILPGLFVRVRIPLGTLKDALLVPESAIGADQAGRFVLVVNPENVVELRLVKLGPREGDMHVILKGIQAEDRVIVNGLLRARPGLKVNPGTASAPSASATPGPVAPRNETGKKTGNETGAPKAAERPDSDS